MIISNLCSCKTCIYALFQKNYKILNINVSKNTFQKIFQRSSAYFDSFLHCKLSQRVHRVAQYRYFVNSLTLTVTRYKRLSVCRRYVVIKFTCLSQSWFPVRFSTKNPGVGGGDYALNYKQYKIS
jgi:hypothetical protein